MLKVESFWEKQCKSTSMALYRIEYRLIWYCSCMMEIGAGVTMLTALVVALMNFGTWAVALVVAMAK